MTNRNWGPTTKLKIPRMKHDFMKTMSVKHVERNKSQQGPKWNQENKTTAKRNWWAWGEINPLFECLNVNNCHDQQLWIQKLRRPSNNDTTFTQVYNLIRNKLMRSAMARTCSILTRKQRILQRMTFSLTFSRMQWPCSNWQTDLPFVSMTGVPTMTRCMKCPNKHDYTRKQRDLPKHTLNVHVLW